MKKTVLFVALLFAVFSLLHTAGSLNPVEAQTVITVRSAADPSKCTVITPSASPASTPVKAAPTVTVQKYVPATSKTVSTPVVKVYRVPVSTVKPQPTTPTPSPAPTPTPMPTPTTPAPGSSQSALQTEMLGYINAERAKSNLAPLVLDSALSNGAYLKSKDMAENAYFSHTSPTYGSPFDMMKSLGISYRSAGENIAKNTSVKGAHTAFMNSSGHRANILSSSFGKIGLGFYQQGNYLYVTQWFTN